MNFSWDENKAKTNQQKHGVSFAEAPLFLATHCQSQLTTKNTLIMKKDLLLSVVR